MKALGRLVRGRGENIVLGALLLAGVFIASQPIADSTRHFHNLIASANGAFLNLFDWAFDLAHLARENVDLREQVSVLSLRVSELEDVEQQNARLRALQDFEARSELTILTDLSDGLIGLQEHRPPSSACSATLPIPWL
jgi:cell shape-determining protein MreC